MKTITLGQLKDLFNARTKSYLSSSIKPYLIDYYSFKDTHVFELNDEEFEHLIRNFNDFQKALLTQWGIIEVLKFKDDSYIIHPMEGFAKIFKIDIHSDGATRFNFKNIVGREGFFTHDSRNYNESRLATQSEIEANTLIKPIDGMYLSHKIYGVRKVCCVDEDRGRFIATSKSGDMMTVAIGFPNHREMKHATESEIKEFNEPELIKLEVGSFIYHPDYGVSKIENSRNYNTDFPVVINKYKQWSLFEKGDQRHKESTYATPEQIAAFKSPWNEGQEEARKYKDGQPCLVSGSVKDGNWVLRYADGNGEFYENWKKCGRPITYKYHLPINSETIKNLPVNE